MPAGKIIESAQKSGTEIIPSCLFIPSRFKKIHLQGGIKIVSSRLSCKQPSGVATWGEGPGGHGLPPPPPHCNFTSIFGQFMAVFHFFLLHRGNRLLHVGPSERVQYLTLDLLKSLFLWTIQKKTTKNESTQNPEPTENVL